VRRYVAVAGACALVGAGVVGYALEVAFFGDNETISATWRIAATSVVALLLVSAAVAIALARRGSAR
jgi:hypothetical protein